MKYTSHKLRIGQKVLNLSEMENNGLFWENGTPVETFTLDCYEFRFDFEEDFNEHENELGKWTTKDAYLTEFIEVVNLDHEETIILSDLDKKMILKVAQEKYYKSEEI